MEYKTLNFKPISSNTEIPEGAKHMLDNRNGIMCLAPTVDIQCYLNYIEFLNLTQNEWVSYGYLDMGMVPLVMLPSFFPPDIKEILSEAAKQIGINVYAMPPVSNLKGKYKGVTTDVWVFREDLAKVLGCSYEKATLSNWLRDINRYTRK